MNKPNPGSVSADTTAAASQSPSCPACPEARMAGAQFCPQCGTKLAHPALPQPTVPSVTEHPDTDKPSANDQHVSFQPGVLLDTDKKSTFTCECGQELFGGADYCFKCGKPQGKAKPQLQLVRIQEGAKTDQAYPVSEEVMIGKAPESDIPLADDQFVSRRHARLCKDDELLFLEDLGSSNGTYLRVRRPIPLEPGDEILIGRTVLRLEQA